MQPSDKISRLIEIMAALRDPETGCPWDIEQDFATIAPYTIEEAYEVADAIARKDLVDLKEELGDLLLQVVYHARMAEEVNEFRFEDVVRGITEKMIRRHPHVFGDEKARSARSAKGMWEKIKAEEKATKRTERLARGLDPQEHGKGFLDGVPVNLPALTRALKLQEKAARVGFDWSEAAPILDKIEEEIGELRVAMSSRRPGRNQGRIRRPVLRAGQSWPASEAGFGSRALRHQRQIPLAVSLCRGRAHEGRAHARRSDAGRDGSALAAGETALPWD